MTRYAKRKLKYSRNENFNLLPYVEWDRFVTLAGAQANEGYVIVSNISGLPLTFAGGPLSPSRGRTICTINEFANKTINKSVLFIICLRIVLDKL